MAVLLLGVRRTCILAAADAGKARERAEKEVPLSTVPVVRGEDGGIMTKIFCADTACRYNDNEVCKASKVLLSWNSVVTLHEGRQEFNRCHTRELGEKAKEIEAFFREKLKKDGLENG